MNSCYRNSPERVEYKGAEYVLAFKGTTTLTKVVFNQVLEVLEINIPQPVINALGPQFSKNWGEFSSMWTLQQAVMKALKSKKTPKPVMPELIAIESAIQTAKKKGIKKFIFYKLWTRPTKSSSCQAVAVKNHEKFHALCDVLRDRHRLYKKKPIGKMVGVIDLCRQALKAYSTKSGEDAIAIILKKMPTVLGGEKWRGKWVSLVDVNLWRMQKLVPKDVAAKYSSSTGLTLFVEEMFADLAGYESVKGKDCQGYYSTYSEEGIEKVIGIGLTIPIVVKELLNVKAAAKEIIDFVSKTPGIFS